MLSGPLPAAACVGVVAPTDDPYMDVEKIRSQELCVSQGGRPGLLYPSLIGLNNYGLRGRTATFKLNLKRSQSSRVV